LSAVVWLLFSPFFLFPFLPFAVVLVSAVVAAVTFAGSLGSAMVAGWPWPTLVSIAPVFPFGLVSAFWVPGGLWRVAAFFAAAFVSILVAAFRAHGSGF
jgi:hypothetical protein